MKVRVYSWFLSRNIGDVLIAKCVSEMFSELYECSYYDITTGKEIAGTEILFPPQSELTWKSKMLNSTYLRNFIDFVYSLRSYQIQNFRDIKEKDCDLAIFAGGNSLMDLGRILPGEVIVTYRRIRALKRKGIKIAFCFSGVGPYESLISRILARKTMKNIDFISVRDEASYKLCKELGRANDVEVWRDPVLIYRPILKGKKKRTIALNVYFGADGSLRKEMRDSYIQLVREIRIRYPGYRVALFSSDTGDYVDVQQVADALEKDTAVEIIRIKDENALFQLYAESQLLIGCRMHSLITAVISDIPIVAIAWQQKVVSLMKFLGYEDRMVEQRDFCNINGAIFQMVERAMKMTEEELCVTKNKLDIARDELTLNMKAFDKRWRNNNEL